MHLKAAELEGALYGYEKVKWIACTAQVKAKGL